jgi:tight adherence protein B
MKRLRLSIAVVGLLLLGSLLVADARADSGAGPELTPIGRLRFPDRGFVVNFGSHLALRKAGVRVWENGQQLRQLAFTPAGDSRQKFGVVLVIDASRSMRGKPLAAAFAAARTFSEHVSPSERIGVVTFSARPQVLLEPTGDPATLRQALRHPAVTKNGTHLFDALAAAMDVLRKEQLSSGSVVLLSDGADTGSSKTEAQLAARAKAEKIRIFTIGLRSKSFDGAPLEELALSSGGAYSEASSTKELRPIYEKIGAQLASAYVLRYRSHATPGERVHVLVRTADGGQTVTEYTAPAPRGVPPYHRSPLARFLAWPGSFAVIALLATALMFGAAFVLIRGPKSNLRERLSHFVSVAAEAGERRGSKVSGLLAARAEKSLRNKKWWPRFTEELEIAKITVPPERIVVGACIGTIVAAVVLLLVSPVFCVFALAVPFGVRAFCRRRLQQQRNRFAEQLPDSLQVFASALRAGHSFAGALAVVAADSEEPTQQEFRRVVADDQVGIPVEESLRDVARRMANSDLEQVALVAELQRHSGGNMAEVLDRVIETIRGRFELRRLVHTLTAQGRMARWIVSMLPVFLFVVISVVNPEYEKTLYQSTGGQFALAVAVLMIIAGSYAIKRIVNIKV